MPDPCPTCGQPVLPRRDMTPDEAKWVARLQRVLLDAPPTVGVLVTGDKHLTVYDRPRALAHEIEHVYDGGSWRHGLVLANVSSAVNLEGVSG